MPNTLNFRYFTEQNRLFQVPSIQYFFKIIIARYIMENFLPLLIQDFVIVFPLYYDDLN